MGRPPLHMTKTLIRFPKDVLDRIDEIAGSNKRPQFIRDAVIDALLRHEQTEQEEEEENRE